MGRWETSSLLVRPNTHQFESPGQRQDVAKPISLSVSARAVPDTHSCSSATCWICITYWWSCFTLLRALEVRQHTSDPVDPLKALFAGQYWGSTFPTRSKAPIAQVGHLPSTPGMRRCLRVVLAMEHARRRGDAAVKLSRGVALAHAVQRISGMEVCTGSLEFGGSSGRACPAAWLSRVRVRAPVTGHLARQTGIRSCSIGLMCARVRLAGSGLGPRRSSAAVMSPTTFTPYGPATGRGTGHAPSWLRMNLAKRRRAGCKAVPHRHRRPANCCTRGPEPTSGPRPVTVPSVVSRPARSLRSGS